MRSLELARGGAVAFGTAMLLVAAAPAGTPTLAAVARIEPGEWQIKTIGSGDAPRALCVPDPAVLIHFNRRSVGCEHVVEVDQPDIATVKYRCGSSGSGRTTLRVSTPRAFDLDLQGLDSGLPFDDSYEGHRLGACGASAR